jgi:hypothetical protein
MMSAGGVTPALKNYHTVTLPVVARLQLTDMKRQGTAAKEEARC